MTFNVTGLFIFLLAIVPGFVAEQSRYLIVPRSLRPRSAIEETGEYVLNSFFVHLVFLLIFRLAILGIHSSALPNLEDSATQNALPQWGREHFLLVATYFLSTLIGGFLFGLFRGVLALNQPIRNLLGGFRWFAHLLERLGVYSFMFPEPVWWGVLRQRSKDELIFLLVKLKNGSGFYTGELKSFGLVEDSKKDKDFYLVNPYFKATNDEQFQKISAEGVLLSFADVDVIEVTKQIRERL